MREELCYTCIWFVPKENKKQMTKEGLHVSDGICKRYPNWIPVNIRHYCGEHKLNITCKHNSEYYN